MTPEDMKLKIEEFQNLLLSQGLKHSAIIAFNEDGTAGMSSVTPLNLDCGSTRLTYHFIQMGEERSKIRAKIV